jgi:alpha-1,3-rhamnosyl/mannosyltransferase
VRWRHNLTERYLLHLGGNKPHKNLNRLVEAWGRLSAGGLPTGGGRQRTMLVFAGREDPRFPLARQRVHALGLAESVRFLGDVPEADVPALYSGAALVVLPSVSEGFGLPAVEAMSCGAPVLCANAGALPEVVGDAALLADPLDVLQLAESINRVLEDRRLSEHLRERGFAQAAKFSWRATAAATRQVYHLVAGALR